MGPLSRGSTATNQSRSLGLQNPSVVSRTVRSIAPTLEDDLPHGNQAFGTMKSRIGVLTVQDVCKVAVRVFRVQEVGDHLVHVFVE
jgi:hypothetical protein